MRVCAKRCVQNRKIMMLGTAFEQLSMIYAGSVIGARYSRPPPCKYSSQDRPTTDMPVIGGTLGVSN